MPEKAIVPYTHEVLGTSQHSTGLSVTTPDGRQIAVSLQYDHPEGVGVFHQYERDIDDKTRSKLTFTLSREAAEITAALYIALGVIKVADVLRIAAEFAKRKEPT
jgi:hypothetical protein